MKLTKFLQVIPLIVAAVFISGCGGGSTSPTSPTPSEPIEPPVPVVQTWGTAKDLPGDGAYSQIWRLPSGRYLSAAAPTGTGLYTTTFSVFAEPFNPISSFDISQSDLRGFEFGSDSQGNIHIVGRSTTANTLNREMVNSVVFNEKKGLTQVTSIDKNIQAWYMHDHRLATSKSGSAMTVISYHTAFPGNTDPTKGTAIFASLYTPNSGWSVPIQISELSEYGGTFPYKVAASENGRFAVLWEIPTKSMTKISWATAVIARIYDPVSGWSPQFTLHKDVGNEISGDWLQLSIANDGVIAAAWKLYRDYDNTQALANVGVYDPKMQSWDLDFIDFPGRRFFQINSNGDGIILWEQTINGCQDGLLGIRFKANGTITTTENLTKEFNCLTSVYHTELFFESFENTAITWSEIFAGERSGSVGGTRLDATGNWTMPIRFASDTIYEGIRSNIEGGRAGIIWREHSSSDFSKKKFLDFSIAP